jgi:hypothetical protein
MASLHEGFARIAEEVEARLEQVGWDVPASLWVLLDADVPDQVRDEVQDDHGPCFALAYTVEMREVLDGHPADALVGIRMFDAVGVALSTEGWAYSAANLERLNKGAVLGAPADCEDRVEVRLVHLLMRDGTEVLVERRRGEDPRVVLDGAFSGRVIWALRRVLGRCSGALTSDVPTVDVVRRGAVGKLVVDALVAQMSIDESHADEVLRVFEGFLEGFLESGHLELWTGLSALGLHEQTWDAALDTARASAAATALDSKERSFLEWADGGMYAAMVHERCGDLTECVQVLETLGERGCAVARLIERM